MHYTGPLELKRAAVWRDRSELLGMRETANELGRPLCAVLDYIREKLDHTSPSLSGKNQAQ